MLLFNTILITSIILTVNCQTSMFNFPAKCDFIQSLWGNTAATQMTCSPGQPCVTWKSALTGPQIGTNGCSRQGVLKVSPGTGTQKTGQISIYIGMFSQKDWTFNIGDSDTNNGYGGDSSSNSWEAEIHNVNNGLFIYENIAWKAGGPPVPSQVFDDYFTTGGNFFGFHSFNVNITKCNNVNMDRIQVPRSKIRMSDDHMYKFDDLYIGLNRVIGSTSRTGVGACAVCINFEPFTKSSCYAPGYQYKTC